MSSADSTGVEKKPNWLLLKEAAEELYRSGKVYFTRKELVSKAREKDPSRSEMSMDFEIDLVTVNGSSKDRYRDPEKLFLYRVDRGRYTLYNPEEHGELEKYIGVQRVSPARKHLIEEVVKELEKAGYDASENRFAKPLQPDIIAEREDERLGVWIIDPGTPLSDQYKMLAYAIGSCLLNKEFNDYVVVVPGELLKRVTKDLIDVLNQFRVRFATVKEERRYTLQL
ncbi:DUF7669 domain-containing protein [Desulfurococcus mucosus]|uniref:DUF7669 domain-containing protein n=1 Tax=Desulfurococcus mucosus (strain ATCC 35584 / DSM 2162 / JCM 9187 / O7/1) TaxID=765177 RepID=E8R7Y9_DESM0|nr:hypothetical protein [Desulfurococcus mucosus]ADV64615.1 hypothetical protein Desmu_0296 [Desulfurococcus mucosus DSM 2162]